MTRHRPQAASASDLRLERPLGLDRLWAFLPMAAQHAHETARLPMAAKHVHETARPPSTGPDSFSLGSMCFVPWVSSPMFDRCMRPLHRERCLAATPSKLQQTSLSRALVWLEAPMHDDRVLSHVVATNASESHRVPRLTAYCLYTDAGNVCYRSARLVAVDSSGAKHDEKSSHHSDGSLCNQCCTLFGYAAMLTPGQPLHAFLVEIAREEAACLAAWQERQRR